MKYLLGAFFFVLVFIWLLLDRNENVSTNRMHPKVGAVSNTAKMPNDEIHNKLNTFKTPPNKNNVSKGFVHEMEMLEKHIAKAPDDTASIKRYGELLFASHKHFQAIDYYKRILRVDKKRKDILLDLTFAYYKLKDFNKAEFYTKQLLNYYPDNLAGQYNLGAIFASKGEKVKASKIWSKLITTSPNSKQAKLAKLSLKKLSK